MSYKKIEIIWKSFELKDACFHWVECGFTFAKVLFLSHVSKLYPEPTVTPWF